MRMLQANNALNQKEFRGHQKRMKTPLDNAREKWICKTAREGEGSAKDGHMRWSCIPKLQMAYAGRIPTRPNTAMNEDGTVTKGHNEVKARWLRHFNKILNCHSDKPTSPNTVMNEDGTPTKGPDEVKAR